MYTQCTSPKRKKKKHRTRNIRIKLSLMSHDDEKKSIRIEKFILTIGDESF